MPSSTRRISTPGGLSRTSLKARIHSPASPPSGPPPPPRWRRRPSWSRLVSSTSNCSAAPALAAREGHEEAGVQPLATRGLHLAPDEAHGAVAVHGQQVVGEAGEIHGAPPGPGAAARRPSRRGNAARVGPIRPARARHPIPAAPGRARSCPGRAAAWRSGTRQPATAGLRRRHTRTGRLSWRRSVFTGCPRRRRACSVAPRSCRRAALVRGGDPARPSVPRGRRDAHPGRDRRWRPAGRPRRGVAGLLDAVHRIGRRRLLEQHRPRHGAEHLGGHFRSRCGYALRDGDEAQGAMATRARKGRRSQRFVRR